MLQLNGEVLKVIDHTVRKTTEETVMELKRHSLITEGRQSPFQKTETLLYNYNHFKAAIKDKEEQIEEIRQIGLRKKSGAVATYSGNTGYIEVKSDMEKAEVKIERIEFSIATTKNFIKIMKNYLKKSIDWKVC